MISQGTWVRYLNLRTSLYALEINGGLEQKDQYHDLERMITHLRERRAADDSDPVTVAGGRGR